MSCEEEVCHGPPNYGSTSTCYVEPTPVVVYQTVGNCPICHVGSIYDRKKLILNLFTSFFHLGRLFAIGNNMFGNCLFHCVLSSWYYLFISVARTKMSTLWIYFRLNFL